MRPDVINWSDKQSHVDIHMLPRQRLQHTIWRWYILFILVQAIIVFGCYVLLTTNSVAQEVINTLQSITFLNDRWRSVEPWLAIGLSVLLGVVLTSLLCLPVFCRVHRRWTQGLHRLHQAIRNLGKGTKPMPLAIGGTAEIDYLLVSFNDMAARLVAGREALIEANQQLEKRVRDRTQMLARATREAEMASEAKGNFLATMSHEIRTPLNGVIGSLELLNQMPMDDCRSEIVRTGRLAADTLLNLINNILDFSAIESGKCELNEKPFSLRQVIDEAISIIAPLAGKKHIDIIPSLSPDLFDQYHGDADRIRQVLINLLNNAIKFTDEGYVELSVAIDREQPARLHFKVRDTGIGIPQVAIDRLFCRFIQAGNDPSHSRGGTGLGLAICKQIIALMGGEMGVQSTKSEGSTFWFTLKLHVAEHTAITHEPETLTKHVLLFESSKTLVSVFRHELESLGCTVTTISEVNRYLNVIHEATFGDGDLIILGDGITGDILNETIDCKHAAARVVVLDWPDSEMIATVNTCTRPDITVLHRPLRIDDLRRLVSEECRVELRDTQNSPPFRLGITVLLVEDNAINQFVGKELLKSLGIAVDIASDGIQAVEAIQAKRYDLALMDCFMPGLDGFAATRRIREMEESGALPGHLPIVALTANAMTTDRDACFAAGMDGYLSKPMDLQQVRNTIVEHVSSASDQSPQTNTPHDEGAAVCNDSIPINLEMLRNVCGHNNERFNHLLNTIRSRFCDFKEHLMNMNCDTSDIEKDRLVHTIVGGAMQCDAQMLVKAARNLEQTEDDQCEAMVTQVIHELDHCLTQLNDYSRSESPSENPRHIKTLRFS